MAAEEPQDSAGPSSPPPPLPEGWLAQWEGVSRKWYYVQRATGKSQWDIPTEPVILTPSTTPGSIGAGPTQAPVTNNTRAGSRSLSPQTLAAESPDLSASTSASTSTSRGFFSGSATTTARPSLSGVLGSGGNSAITQIADRVIGRIAGKHGSQSSSPSHGGYESGHSTVQNQAGHNSYGYASTGQSGAYTGNAPQYHPQGQAGSQQNEYSQHAPAGSSAYPPQYHTGQPAPPSQFSVNSGQQQPWPTQNSFPQNPHAAYQQTDLYGQPAGNIPLQPEWQSSAHPPVPHSTKPGSQPPQLTSHNPSAITNNHPQPNNTYQLPYHQQIPQHVNQQGPNPYGHGRYPPQQAMHGNPSIGGPMHPGQQPPQPYAPNFQQHPSVPGSQQPSSYHPNSAAPAPPPGITKFQNNSPISPMNPGPSGNNFQPQPPPSQLPQHNNLTSPPSQYPPNNIPNNPPSHNSFAVEQPDNQIMNMQNRQPSQQQYGQLQQTYPQPSLPPKPHQQPPPNSMGMDVGPGPTPMRHTPTDPSFVSGPWTSPPANVNHHYPPNRYNNNPGGY